VALNRLTIRTGRETNRRNWRARPAFVRERTLDTPIEKIMLSLTAFADELEMVRRISRRRP
jgi:hypothetical protein